MTVMVYPAMVRTPEREEVLVFAAAKKLTVPGPLPEAPEIIGSQLALLDAVHGQPAPVDTAIVPLTPPVVGVRAPGTML